ncbi:hypothetical protein N0V82_003671 [Gnomoniopsis sp. IMI 355080]|nr:hypothetical protein N0V82_003671 [Gnomoniopsis sp. IMI 355080]
MSTVEDVPYLAFARRDMAAAAALGTAASALSVVDLAAKVGGEIFQYTKDVLGATEQAKQRANEFNSLMKVGLSLSGLLEDKKAHLKASNNLDEELQQCQQTLQDILKRLNTASDNSRRTRWEFALTWHFKQPDFEEDVKKIVRSRDMLQAALQVDQTKLLVHVSERLDSTPLNLPEVKGAAYNSFDNQHGAKCLPNTRVEMLQRIRAWVERPDGPLIFWLSGMAGTGKSTISRTICEELGQNSGDAPALGASFFFKKGELDRNGAAKFVPSLVAQLVRSTLVPDLKSQIEEALRKFPDITSKTLQNQWNTLLRQPLAKAAMTGLLASSTLVFVVDALDECEDQKDATSLIELILQLEPFPQIRLRFLLTSRPELPIQRRFKRASENAHKDVFLHEVPTDVVGHDIQVYLEFELRKLREDHELSDDWPGKSHMRKLVDLCSPLFIHATTICRFLANPSGTQDPKDLLAGIMSRRYSEDVTLKSIYQPVLDQIVAEINSEHLRNQFPSRLQAYSWHHSHSS